MPIERLKIEEHVRLDMETSQNGANAQVTILFPNPSAVRDGVGNHFDSGAPEETAAQSLLSPFGKISPPESTKNVAPSNSADNYIEIALESVPNSTAVQSDHKASLESSACGNIFPLPLQSLSPLPLHLSQSQHEVPDSSKHSSDQDSLQEFSVHHTAKAFLNEHSEEIHLGSFENGALQNSSESSYYADPRKTDPNSPSGGPCATDQQYNHARTVGHQPLVQYALNDDLPQVEQVSWSPSSFVVRFSHFHLFFQILFVESTKQREQAVISPLQTVSIKLIYLSEAHECYFTSSHRKSNLVRFQDPRALLLERCYFCTIHNCHFNLT